MPLVWDPQRGAWELSVVPDQAWGTYEFYFLEGRDALRQMLTEEVAHQCDDFDMADDNLALSDFDDLVTFGYLSPPSGDACLPILEGEDLFRSRAPSRADSTSSYNTRPRHALRDGLLAHATVI